MYANISMYANIFQIRSLVDCDFRIIFDIARTRLQYERKKY